MAGLGLFFDTLIGGALLPSTHNFGMVWVKTPDWQRCDSIEANLLHTFDSSEIRPTGQHYQILSTMVAYVRHPFAGDFERLCRCEVADAPRARDGFSGESSGMRWAMRFGWWKSPNENGSKYQEGLMREFLADIVVYWFCNLRHKCIQLDKWFSREFPNSTWPWFVSDRSDVSWSLVKKYVNWIYIVFPLANRRWWCSYW